MSHVTDIFSHVSGIGKNVGAVVEASATHASARAVNSTKMQTL